MKNTKRAEAKKLVNRMVSDAQKLEKMLNIDNLALDITELLSEKVDQKEKEILVDNAKRGGHS